MLAKCERTLIVPSTETRPCYTDGFLITNESKLTYQSDKLVFLTFYVTN